MWSYVLLLKTRELAQYLVEKRKTVDFRNPYYAVERQDSGQKHADYVLGLHKIKMQRVINYLLYYISEDTGRF